MTTRRGLFFAALGLGAVATTAHAQRNGYCEGYRAGWEGAFRNRNMPTAPVPPCPPAPAGAYNSYEAGFEAGMIAALQRISSRRY